MHWQQADFSFNTGSVIVIAGYVHAPFTKTIDGNKFHFQAFLEGSEESCRVSVDGQHFKMTVGNADGWEIRQQVPSWIKRLEEELAEVIENVYC